MNEIEKSLPLCKKSSYSEMYLAQKKIDSSRYGLVQAFGAPNIQINLNCPRVECMHSDCDKCKYVVCARIYSYSIVYILNRMLMFDYRNVVMIVSFASWGKSKISNISTTLLMVPIFTIPSLIMQLFLTFQYFCWFFNQ